MKVPFWKLFRGHCFTLTPLPQKMPKRKQSEEVEYFGDDDQAVESFKEKRARAAATAEDKALKAAPGGEDGAFKALLKDLLQIRANIAGGDAIIPIESAYLIVNPPITGRHAVTLACIGDYMDESSSDDTSDEEAAATAAAAPAAKAREAAKKKPKTREILDFTLFSALCGDGMLCCMSEELEELSTKYATPSQALPALVSTHPKTAALPAPERARLVSKFSAWFQGVRWEDCRMSATNRPSLASWEGFPWEMSMLEERCLNRGLVGGARIQVACMIEPQFKVYTEGVKGVVPFKLKGGEEDAREALELAWVGGKERVAEEDAAAAAKKKAKKKPAVAGAAAGKGKGGGKVKINK